MDLEYHVFAYIPDPRGGGVALCRCVYVNRRARAGFQASEGEYGGSSTRAGQIVTAVKIRCVI